MIELAAWSIFDFVRFLLLAIQTAMQVSSRLLGSACVDGSRVCAIYYRVSRYV